MCFVYCLPEVEQCIQRSPLCVGEPRCKASVQPALRASGNLRTEPFDDPDQWNDDMLAPHCLDQRISQHEALISLIG